MKIIELHDVIFNSNLSTVVGIDSFKEHEELGIWDYKGNAQVFDHFLFETKLYV